MTLVEAIKPDIMDTLATGNKSISEIAQALHLNYYTVRQAVKELEADRSIVITGYPGTRNLKYALQANGDFVPDSRNTIPRIIIEGKGARLIEYLFMRKNTNPLASQAVLNIPKHIMRLAMLAERFSANDTSANFSLEALRIEMETDLSHLEKAVSMYQQILRNKRNWNPDELKTWLDDPAYIKKEVEETHAYYSTE